MTRTCYSVETGTSDRGRTYTGLSPLEPKSRASTNSATLALVLLTRDSVPLGIQHLCRGTVWSDDERVSIDTRRFHVAVYGRLDVVLTRYSRR